MGIGLTELVIILAIVCLCGVGITALVGGGIWLARGQQRATAIDEDRPADNT